MDDADRAQLDYELEQERMRMAIVARSVRFRQEVKNCVECGDEIPELRREALPGIDLCIHCAADLEERR